MNLKVDESNTLIILIGTNWLNNINDLENWKLFSNLSPIYHNRKYLKFKSIVKLVRYLSALKNVENFNGIKYARQISQHSNSQTRALSCYVEYIFQYIFRRLRSHRKETNKYIFRWKLLRLLLKRDEGWRKLSLRFHEILEFLTEWHVIFNYSVW